ncbi:MAG: hypothetical protein PVJ57_01435 [Phycisphaerae bacterium]|jgi:hypothetical protein
MADPIQETLGQRLPPLITRVPPPGPPPAKRGPVGTAAVLALLAVLFLVIGGSDWPEKWFTLSGKILLGTVVLSGLVAWFQDRQMQRAGLERAAHAAQFAEWEADPLARTLSALWSPPHALLHVKTALMAIGGAPEADPPRARLVCIGGVDLPEIGDYRFEPVIITPTRFLGRQLWLAGLASLVFAFPAGRAAYSAFSSGGDPVGPLFMFLCAAATLPAAWVWRSAIRPTYIRLAPGMVQIVTFPFGRGKPNIRSYPMSAGTVVLVQRLPGARARLPRVITLARDGQRDDLPLWQMSGRAELTERLWQALLSTAPTPPLSDEELLG